MGPRLVCLPPKGEGKWNVARIEKLVLRKMITIEKWCPFFDFGVRDSFAFPLRGKANRKLLGSKNLFCGSWTGCQYYYTEWSLFFLFGDCKLASALLQVEGRCRPWVSAPGAARLVFLSQSQPFHQKIAWNKIPIWKNWRWKENKKWPQRRCRAELYKTPAWACHLPL